jgi:cleavage and polyadenylation specificity factor subunit 2
MGRIAVTEDVEDVRDEEDIGDDPQQTDHEAGFTDAEQAVETVKESTPKSSGRYIATTQEVHEAFDSVNTLRYSQPTHLQGPSFIFNVDLIV